jgi:hypothetical protein
MPVSVSVFCPFFLHGQTVVIVYLLTLLTTRRHNSGDYNQEAYAIKLKCDVAVSVEIVSCVLPEFWIILYNNCVNLRNGDIVHFGHVYMFLCIFSLNSYCSLPVHLCCLEDLKDNLPTLGDVNGYGELVKSILSAEKLLCALK